MEPRSSNFHPFSMQETNNNNQWSPSASEIDDSTLVASFGGLNLSADTFPSSYAASGMPASYGFGHGQGPVNATNGSFLGTNPASYAAAGFGQGLVNAAGVNGNGSYLGNNNNSSFGFSQQGNVPLSVYDYMRSGGGKFNNGSQYDYNSGYGHSSWYNSGGMSLNSVENYNSSMLRSIQQQQTRSRTRSSLPSMRYHDETSNGYQNGSQTSFSRQLGNFSSVEDLRGKMFIVAKDQIGCRFLQRKVEEGNLEEIQMIYSELKDYVCDLMVHQFANYLIKKVFEVCNEQQITQLLVLVINNHRNFMEICFDEHGTRSVQKLIEHLTTHEQFSLFVSVTCRITFALTKDLNGHHVIQHCCEYIPCEFNKHILNVIAENCLDIAMDRSGCCVLQQCVGKAQGEPLQRLVAEISANALSLAEHPYGNFVVQYVLGLDIPRAKMEIVARLSGNFVLLSLNKYGSNVVEKCLRECKGPLIPKIVNELMCSPNFLMILQDPYGNYVVQSAIAESTGVVQNKLVTLIQSNYEYLHSHPYGKRILARCKGIKSYQYRM